jgi:hypothetical protein
MAINSSQGVYWGQNEKEKVWIIAAQVLNNALHRTNSLTNEAWN